MKTKLFAGAVAAGAALGGLGMTGTASAWSGPIQAPIPVAHCNVLVYDGCRFAMLQPWRGHDSVFCLEDIMTGTLTSRGPEGHQNRYRG